MELNIHAKSTSPNIIPIMNNKNPLINTKFDFTPSPTMNNINNSSLLAKPCIIPVPVAL